MNERSLQTEGSDYGGLELTAAFACCSRREYVELSRLPIAKKHKQRQ
jgi:hypothetical protein